MLITLTILLGLSTLTTSEVKGNNAMKLCGQEFFVTYKLLCGGGMRGKRSILALPKRIKKGKCPSGFQYLIFIKCFYLLETECFFNVS